MKKFYTDVFQHKDKLLVSGYENGKRFRKDFRILPEVYIASRNGNSVAQDLFGNKLSQLPEHFLFDARKTIKEYEDSGQDLYYNPRFAQAEVFKLFQDQVVDTPLIRVGCIDIECEVETGTGMPNHTTAAERINAITLGLWHIYHVFGMMDFDPSKIEHIRSGDNQVVYHQAVDEREMLREFIREWQALDLDICIGWNNEIFDFPYLYARMVKLLGESIAAQLSPWGIVEDSTFKGRFGNEEETINIAGVTIIDYLQVYKKFRRGTAESFKLGNIAFDEIKAKKIDGGFKLYQTNPQKFYEYNQRDVELVLAMDDKLMLMELVFALAYDAMCFYRNVFSQVMMWDCIACNRLKQSNIIPKGTRGNRSNHGIEGAFVKDPPIGLHDWVMSFDVNSEYPSLIILFNMSPDTIVKGKERMQVLENWYLHHKKTGNITAQNIIMKFIDAIPVPIMDIIKCPGPLVPHNDDYTMTAKGVIFRKGKIGFLPQLMQEKYDKRSDYKKKMIEAEKKLEAVNAELKRRKA